MHTTWLAIYLIEGLKHFPVEEQSHIHLRLLDFQCDPIASSDNQKVKNV